MFYDLFCAFRCAGIRKVPYFAAVLPCEVDDVVVNAHRRVELPKLTDAGQGIDTELDERVIYGTVHGIRLIHVAGAFDGDNPLVIGIAGRTPAAVLFLDTK